MNGTVTTKAAALLNCASPPPLADARVAVAHFAAFAAKAEHAAETTPVGNIAFGIPGGNDATATATLAGQEAVVRAAGQLTRPFPCGDES